MNSETDQEVGALHPRERFDFVGHVAQATALADAINSPRMHHAWLVTGPKGVGKATLVYRAARVLLGARAIAGPPLSVAADHAISRQILQLAHPDLLVVRKGINDTTGKPRSEITVDEARKLAAFFALKASIPGGRRVSIIDAADDLNRNAANALLKTLEEPPEGGVIFLIAHSPGRLLPTIRSRCRRLVLGPLSEAEVKTVAGAGADMAAVTLAHGAPGRAVSLSNAQAGRLYRRLAAALGGIPRLPLDDAFALADMSAKTDFEFDVLFDLIEDWLLRTAQAAAGLPIVEIEPGESAAMERMGKAAGGRRLAEAWDKVREIRSATHGLNLDKAASVLDALRFVRRNLAPASAKAA